MIGNMVLPGNMDDMLQEGERGQARHMIGIETDPLKCMKAYSLANKPYDSWPEGGTGVAPGRMHVL